MSAPTTDRPKIKVRYTCPICKTVDREVEVRTRFAEEDVVDWVEWVRMKVGQDHQEHKPRCPSFLCDLKIPINKGDDARIGEEVKPS